MSLVVIRCSFAPYDLMTRPIALRVFPPLVKLTGTHWDCQNISLCPICSSVGKQRSRLGVAPGRSSILFSLPAFYSTALIATRFAPTLYGGGVRCDMLNPLMENMGPCRVQRRRGGKPCEGAANYRYHGFAHCLVQRFGLEELEKTIDLCWVAPHPAQQCLLTYLRPRTFRRRRLQ